MKISKKIVMLVLFVCVQTVFLQTSQSEKSLHESLSNHKPPQIENIADASVLQHSPIEDIRKDWHAKVDEIFKLADKKDWTELDFDRFEEILQYNNYIKSCAYSLKDVQLPSLREYIDNSSLEYGQSGFHECASMGSIVEKMRLSEECNNKYCTKTKNVKVSIQLPSIYSIQDEREECLANKSVNNNNLKALQLMRHYGLDLHEDLQVTSRLLSDAIKMQSDELAQEILSYKTHEVLDSEQLAIQEEIYHRQVSNYDSSLAQSMHIDSTTMMQLLLANGARVNYPCHENMTLLHRAALDNKCQFIPLLLNAGAKISGVDNIGWTPLHYAIGDTNDFIKFAKSTFVCGYMTSSKLTRQDKLYPNYGFHTHVEGEDKYTMVKLLLDAGADVNHGDKFGHTPLFYAQCKKLKGIIALLTAVESISNPIQKNK